MEDEGLTSLQVRYIPLLSLLFSLLKIEHRHLRDNRAKDDAEQHLSAVIQDLSGEGRPILLVAPGLRR